MATDVEKRQPRNGTTVRTVHPGHGQPCVPSLAVLSGPNAGEVIPVQDGMIIGRAPTAQFRPSDRGVSRQHVMITVAPVEKALWITDLGSTNGTLVAGQPVDTVMLRDGEQFTIGQTTFLLFTHRTETVRPHLWMYGKHDSRDPQTGLYSRRYLQERLRQVIESGDRRRTPVVVLLVEVEEPTPDPAGGAWGVAPESIITVAKRVASSIRVEDIAARYDHRRLAVMCAGVSTDVGKRIARRVLRAARFELDGADEQGSNLSMGMASTGELDRDSSAQGLLQAAEAELARSRQAHRD